MRKILFILFICGLTQVANAEFLRTLEGVYQSTDLRAKVVVSYDVPGVFVLYGPETDIQTFHPAHLRLKNTLHVFISYDPARKRYNKIKIGKSIFAANGSFVLKMGDLRITIDNQNPYLSIVNESSTAPGIEPAILGLVGTEVILNQSGEELVALLEAHQFNKYRALIKPYKIGLGGLKLRGKAVETDTIGVSLEPPRNKCLPEIKPRGVVYLTSESLESLKDFPEGEQRLRYLKRLIAKGRSKNPQKDLLLLRVQKDSILGFDYKQAQVKLITPLKSTKGPTTICVIKNVELE